MPPSVLAQARIDIAEPPAARPSSHAFAANTLPHLAPQSLVALSDAEEYRSGLACFKGKRWHGERWKTFRLRYGVYGQRQDGFHMVRAKTPGGRLSFAAARAAARANRAHCGGDIHITTRQDLQFYFVGLEATADLIEALARGGITTREASGNTFRNPVSCPLAGSCPREHVDAARVAEQLATSWIRHPLVQHMPRKFKAAVSGCGHDCAGTSRDDLGFIAMRDEAGRPGFKVVVGGGLGARPRSAVTLADFVPEGDLPAVQEALAWIHHRLSNRANKNASRVKFLVDRLGADGLRAEFEQVFARLRALPRRPWQPLDWNDAPEPGPAPAPHGVHRAADGTVSVMVGVPLGQLSSSQLETLAELAESLGAREFRLTATQNLLVVGLAAERLDALRNGITEFALEVDEAADALSDLVSCPGVSTCALGITNSQALSESLLGETDSFAGLPQVRIRISGCHNSCAQHHLADIGLHGLAKKVGGRPAPHYQFHIGGEDRGPEAHGTPGPVVPAGRVVDALRLVLADYARDRADGETVRGWYGRTGPERLEALLAPLGAADSATEATFVDVGANQPFSPPVPTPAECAAGAVVADHLSDLAAASRDAMLRAARAGDDAQAWERGGEALVCSARRLMAILDQDPGEEGDTAALLAAVRSTWNHDGALIAALEAALAAGAGEAPHCRGAVGLDLYRARLAAFGEAVDDAVERMLAPLASVL